MVEQHLAGQGSLNGTILEDHTWCQGMAILRDFPCDNCLINKLWCQFVFLMFAPHSCVNFGERWRKFTNNPWKFNIAPEKWWLEDYFPIGKVTFQGLCYFGRVFFNSDGGGQHVPVIYGTQGMANIYGTEEGTAKAGRGDGRGRGGGWQFQEWLAFCNSCFWFP